MAAPSGVNADGDKAQTQSPPAEAKAAGAPPVAEEAAAAEQESRSIPQGQPLPSSPEETYDYTTHI